MSGWTTALLYCGGCQCASVANTSALILLGKELIPALRLWIYSITPQWVGLIDVVFATLLHTPHPYHLSSTAQQQLWLSSQTIRTVHITAHDRHKLSRAHRLTAYSNVPGALPGCQLRYQEKLRTKPMDLYNVQQSSYVKQQGHSCTLRYCDASVNVCFATRRDLKLH